MLNLVGRDKGIPLNFFFHLYIYNENYTLIRLPIYVTLESPSPYYFYQIENNSLIISNEVIKVYCKVNTRRRETQQKSNALGFYTCVCLGKWGHCSSHGQLVNSF